MTDHDGRTTEVLTLLRAALDALHGLGDDLPDRGRLLATLDALDPKLGGAALAPPAWVEATGLPAPEWVGRARALRQQLLASPPADVDLPDEGLVRATALAPELGQRLVHARAFHRFLLRNPLFPPSHSEVAEDDDGVAWWTWDHLLSDGRWGRIRVEGATHRAAPKDDSWFRMSFEELEAEAAYDPVRRCILGPVWRKGHQPAGLVATLEVSGAPTEVRVAVDRMQAEDVDVRGTIVPFALPADE